MNLTDVTPVEVTGGKKKPTGDHTLGREDGVGADGEGGEAFVT